MQILLTIPLSPRINWVRAGAVQTGRARKPVARKFLSNGEAGGGTEGAELDASVPGV